MRKFLTFFPAGLTFFLLFTATINAEDIIPVCDKLGDKVTGEMMKYSVSADVDGAVYFGDIACAHQYRTKEFCAMEMVSFDSSARVFDYYTANELEMSKAFFVVDEKNGSVPIPAFESKNAAEKYAAAHPGAVILDFTALVDREIK